MPSLVERARAAKNAFVGGSPIFSQQAGIGTVRSNVATKMATTLKVTPPPSGTVLPVVYVLRSRVRQGLAKRGIAVGTPITKTGSPTSSQIAMSPQVGQPVQPRAIKFS